MQNTLATQIVDEQMDEATTQFLGRVYQFPQRAPGATVQSDELTVIRSQVDSHLAQRRILASNPMDLV
jgi:hypothetical protein